MEFTNLAKGTSIVQRYNILKKYYKETYQSYDDTKLINYTKWRQRPTMVTDERFEEILRHLNLTKEAFDFAIKELDATEKEYIYKEISQDDWVRRTQLIFAQEDVSINDINEEDKLNFAYALRFHVEYFRTQINQLIQQFPEISISNEASMEYLGEVINRLMEIGLRTFVYDLHAEKDKIFGMNDLDERTGFKKYLHHRFDAKEKVVVFFTQYPVLTRLYAEIIDFQLTNFKELLQALKESQEELMGLLSTEEALVLTGLKMGAGDSHDRGKSVAMLTFNQQSDVVYKPKNLEIGNRFDQFVTEIKQMNSNFDFYLTRKITKATYTFEERLIYSECTSEEDIHHFYRQFGQTIALVYLLNGNDFHLENVLSFGKYPVLIDLETIIQNPMPMPDGEHALAKAVLKNAQSVVMSGLVPIYLFEERAEEDVDGAARGLQLSALSGGEQKLPYKVLKLINYDSVNMQFQYQEHITDASENIPMFRGEKVDFVPYIDDILDGFKEFSTFALENKEQLVQIAERIFSDCLVRHVIKTTQSYTDMLDYSVHPTCMMDYIEREKLFENLWMHGYESSKPVPYEVRDLLQHDIPIFFNATNSKSLIASQGEEMPNIYRQPAIDLELDKLRFFSKEEINEQIDYLYPSFGLYHPMNLQTTKIPLLANSAEGELLIDGAKAIGKLILDKAFWGDKSITWRNVEETSPENYIVGMMNENFYDGITGMYLYLGELYHVTKEERVGQALYLAEELVLKLEEEYVDSVSAFYGSLSAVYPLLRNYQYTSEERLLNAAQAMADIHIDRYNTADIKGYDWNGGIASIIHIFVLLYKVTEKDVYLLFARRLLKDLNVEELTQGGFAHGYSGVIYAANSIYKVKQDTEIEQLIRTCLEKERETFDTNQQGWLDLRVDPPIINDLWCYGSLGIGMAYLDLYLSGFEDSKLAGEISLAADRIIHQEKRDDCLCHGNFGDVEFLLQYSQSSLATVEQKNQIAKKIEKIQLKIADQMYTFEGLSTIPKYGMFTGLSGIGHQILRMKYPEEITDILTLSLSEK